MPWHHCSDSDDDGHCNDEGFRAKALIENSNCTEEEVEALTCKFLGLLYCPKEDCICMGIKTLMQAWHKSQQWG